ncbi:CD3324 family protein [Treponema sp. UBA6852]|uniref:CD3324 family protein n=1 Tax=Treponema sp. UBA6852 TaxID=1947744 RepID=UPI0025F75428|nr:CD3324 family protein [Treponema sp. UBA6852]
MDYVKAKNILPSELLEKIQEYAAGTYLYIPQKCENRKNWGESKDSKNWYKRRNQRIYKNYKEGFSVSEISQEFFLSEKSIYRIILCEKKADELDFFN